MVFIIVMNFIQSSNITKGIIYEGKFWTTYLLFSLFRSRELQGFLDSIRRGQEQVLGDLSMILCDPYAINFLANSVIRLLQHLMNNEAMPRVWSTSFIQYFSNQRGVVSAFL